MTQAPDMKYFAYAHLPPNLQDVSRPVGQLAERMLQTLPACPEKDAGMRKLLEAKDCFVRAALEMPKSDAPQLPPHLVRVQEEKRELDDRVEKLRKFIAESDAYVGLPGWERNLLQRQLVTMAELSQLLYQRLNHKE